MIPNISVSISALPKSGKTHLALTFPDPIRVFSFDGGAEYVRGRFPEKEIDIVTFRMPIIESSDDSSWAPPIWDAFYKDYKEAVYSGQYNTVVIDTATTAHTILQQSVFEWLKDEAALKGKEKKKMAVNEYHTRNLLMKALFDLPQQKGINLVTTQYLGEKWLQPAGGGMAQPTGETKVQGWAQTEGFADINLEMESKMKAGKAIKVTTVVSTRFDQATVGQKWENTSFDEIVALMFED